MELSLTWSSSGVGAGLALDHPLDLSAPGTTLDLRTIVDPTIDGQRVRIQLTDADGDAWQTNPRDLTGLTGGYIRTYWGQTLRVDPGNAPPRLDLDEVAVVTLVAASPQGRVWVVDAAARRPALRPVPDVRLSTFSLGRRVVVDEGDGPGEATATMTYTLDEPSPRPAKVTVAAATYDNRVMVRGIPSTCPAGATEGSFEVPYEADAIDDVARTTVFLQAIGERSVMVGDQFSQVVILDDDPDARLSVRRATPGVAPGQQMVWRLRLDRLADYGVHVTVNGLVTQPRRRNLLVSDVPARWAEQHLRGDPGAGRAGGGPLPRPGSCSSRGNGPARSWCPRGRTRRDRGRGC